MIVVKFVKPWGPYNAGETAGFAPEQLKERINVGAGPEQGERIPRSCYVGATDEQKAAVAQLFGEAAPVKEEVKAEETPAEPPASSATPTPPTS
jgi:hypothetical protein